MTDLEREQLKAQYPNCWFCRVTKSGWSVLLAIPKRTDDPDIPSMPGLTLSMLHGTTMRLEGK